MVCYTTQQICDHVQGQLDGPGDLAITGLEHLGAATPDQLSFIRDEKHARRWPASRAGAALVTRGIPIERSQNRALIRVADADLAMAAVLELYAPPISKPTTGVDASARVDPLAQIGRDVSIGPGCYVGPGARIGDNSTLCANVTVLDDAKLDDHCLLFPGVVIRERSELGSRVVVHPNAVIGADGFGYRPNRNASGWVKIPQIGNVRIEDDVEIGAGTCIDRGKFSETVIGQGTKIDNLCQIAHNCRIGRHCVLAAQVGLAGGVIVEDGAVIAGQVGVAEHITIGSAARLAAGSGIMDNVPAGASWFGYPAHDTRATLREVAATRRLPKLVKALRKKRII